MAKAPYTYNPKNVSVIVGGAPITGFTEGTFVNVAFNNDAYTRTGGADGEQARNRNNDRSGTITLTLMQTSGGNNILNAWAALDEQTDAGVFTILVKPDGVGGFYQGTGWVQKKADAPFEMEISDREWVIEVAELEYVPPIYSTTQAATLPTP